MNNLIVRKVVLVTSALVVVLISIDFLIGLIVQKIYERNLEMNAGELVNLAAFKYVTIHLIKLTAFIILYIWLGKKLLLRKPIRLLLCMIGYVFCSLIVKFFI